MILSESTYYDLKSVTAISTSLSDQVAKELGRQIVAGSMTEYTELPKEGELAERFQVSRGVARDAIKILSRKGLIKIQKKLATKVNPITEWQLFDDDVLAWLTTSNNNQYLMTQIMEWRLALEPNMMACAAERADVLSIQNIKQARDDLTTANPYNNDFIVAYARFYQAALRAVNNDFLNAMVGVTYSSLLIAVKLTEQNLQARKQFICNAASLTKAIAARDALGSKQQSEQSLLEMLALINPTHLT